MTINNPILLRKWVAIKRHVSKVVAASEYKGMIRVNNNDTVFYIAKNAQKIRPKSFLDWCHYEPADLAHAIATDTVLEYYEYQLLDVKTTPNVWKRKDEEHEIKAFYAAREHRAELI